VAQKGEFGNDTWEGDSWKDRAAANAGQSSASTPTRHRFPAADLARDRFITAATARGRTCSAIRWVALDAASGKRLWHFQTVHHNLWDYDLPAQPVLVEVRHEGRVIPRWRR